MSQADWDRLVAEQLPNVNDQSDFYAYLRKDGFGTDSFRYETLLRLCRDWARGKRRGKHQQTVDRQRRATFGPGKFYGASSGTVHLNKTHVKGWRGINPVNP